MIRKKDSLPAYLFHEGTNFQAYRYLGFHPEKNKFIFRVWAPNAAKVSVIGEFTGWEELPAYRMTRVTEAGIWELSAKDIPADALYKYYITASDGRTLCKADPYAAYAEVAPGTASRARAFPTEYAWTDGGWMQSRQYARDTTRPMNIYELHAASWIRHEDGSRTDWEELARELAPYVKRMGYTHVELMPVMEHPFEGSWGYQVTGYYAPNSRLGTPEQFCGFVETMHNAGIGVILDWVPGHFPKDAHGLCEFDGRPLYEYQGKDRMENEGWGTRCFDLGRNEVESFLISDAVFWADVYHADGLRVDAVSSMLYLDYGRKPGEWFPNMYGDNRNLEAIAFFRKLNGYMESAYPQVLRVAEESTAFPDVTRPVPEGLGFTHKWNMGWMNDTLAYKKTDPVFRKYEHEKMTFSLCYAFSEKYILPVSHDEVVHGKQTLLDRTPGEYWQKFADTRAYLMYMTAHPGKKLHFMGNEIGQFAEWNYEKSVEWFLLSYDAHRQMQQFTADLNHIYLQNPEFWQRDDSFDGFAWVDPDNRDENVLSFRRFSDAGEILVVLNFSAVYRPVFRVGVPERSSWRQLISSDEAIYGGAGVSFGTVKAAKIPYNGMGWSLNLRLPPLGGLIFKKVPPKSPTETK